MPDYSVKQVSQFSTLLIANGGSGGEAFSLQRTETGIDFFSVRLAIIFFSDSQDPHLFGRVFYSVCLLHVHDFSLPINIFLQRVAV